MRAIDDLVVLPVFSGDKDVAETLQHVAENYPLSDNIDRDLRTQTELDAAMVFLVNRFLRLQESKAAQLSRLKSETYLRSDEIVRNKLGDSTRVNNDQREAVVNTDDKVVAIGDAASQLKVAYDMLRNLRIAVVGRREVVREMAMNYRREYDSDKSES